LPWRLRKATVAGVKPNTFLLTPRQHRELASRLRRSPNPQARPQGERLDKLAAAIEKRQAAYWRERGVLSR
jgi:hypothetical protein